MKLNKKLLFILITVSLFPALIFRIIEWRKGQFSSFYEFFESLLFNSIFSIIITLIISWAILSTLYWLNKRVPWTDNILKRLLAEILTTFPIALLLGYIIGNILFYVNPYHNQTYSNFIFNFLIISAVMNFVLVAISDWFYFFNRWKDSLVENQKILTDNAILEKENIESQYEVLKNQINPHFLFNSLNVLSSLVHTNPDKAEDFIDEFAELYRYILDQNIKDIVPLYEEIKISKSYVFLQEIRFEKAVECHFNFEAKDMVEYYIFPLAAQTLLENALKHNTATLELPLKIEISIHENHLIVSNNLQVRAHKSISTGIGISNLTMRYKHFNLIPIFEKTETHYNCYLPLMKKDMLPKK